MTPLAGWRQELKGLIPRGFLRRDQGPGLFISDFPRQGEAGPVAKALAAAGYTVKEEKGLALIDGEMEKYRALAAGLPSFHPTPADRTLFLCSLGNRLLRFGGDLTEENLPLLRLTLKTLDAGGLDALERLLPPACALAQRRHVPLPRAAGLALLGALNEMERKESPC